jgi:hypothetical protein
MKAKIVLCGLLAAISLSVSCTDSKIADFNSKEDGPFVPSEEAQTMAIWLSGELEAPMDMAREIDRDLSHMRANFSEQVPDLLTIHFVFTCPLYCVGLDCKPETTKAILNGIYHEWAELNDYFGVTNISTYFADRNVIYLNYTKIANPYLVADEYERLDGVIRGKTALRIGDWSNIYPWYVNDEISYLLRYGFMDCAVDCTINHFWYFKKTDGVIALVGDYDPEIDSIPAWWEEIEPAYCMYIYNNDGKCWPRDYPN